MTAAPPPMLGDLYNPEAVVPAIVRHVAAEGWPHPFYRDELDGVARVLARAIYPHSPYRSGSCAATYGEGHAPLVTCTAARPALGTGTSSAVLLKVTGCRYAAAVWSSPVARGFTPCAIFEDGSVRAVVIGGAA